MKRIFQFGLEREKVIEIGLRILPIVDRVLMRFSTTRDYQIFPNELFPWTSYLEENWSVIRDEAQRLLQDRMSVPSLREISPDHKKIAVDDSWRSFLFRVYGIRAARNCALCPQTACILENIPGLLSALYSVMLKGAHVPKHTGPTKSILTVHLGLVIPRRRQDCHMRIGDRDVTWEEGKVVIFDDMAPHEVWNSTQEDRIILLLHIKRPLRLPGAMLRNLLLALVRLSPFVQDGVRNMQKWEPAPHGQAHQNARAIEGTNSA